MRKEPKPGNVKIPKSTLRTQLDKTAELKRAMLEQLRALESHAAGRPVTKPGAWRHDTSRWPNVT